jgi:energy-coupling factor transporter ATP-binding protein EcfA2
MIHRAKFQNFKALKDVEVTFDRRLTVLVGPNGSGKSSVLNGLKWVCDLASGPPRADQGMTSFAAKVRESYSGQGAPQLIEAAEQTAAGALGFRLTGHPSASQPSAEKFAGRNTSNSQLHSPPKPSFGPAELIQLKPERLAAPTMTTATPPPMGTDGTGLASLMAYFKLYDEPRFDQVVELFQKVISQVERVRIDRVTTGQQQVMGEGLVFDLPGRKGVPASAMSDGTLYALGLIVKILDPQRPKTLLIDDIDHGFHPKAQLTLVELLHKLLDEIPDLQIIATSHSPYILSGLDWDEVRVTGLKEDGSAVIAPLTRHPNYEKWKESMSPGEFWTHAGEDWVLRLPQPEVAGR